MAEVQCIVSVPCSRDSMVLEHLKTHPCVTDMLIDAALKSTGTKSCIAWLLFQTVIGTHMMS